MQLAFAAFERGDDAEAERLCRAVLAARANYFDALHMLGVMAAKAGRAEEAVAVLAKAIAANPRSADAQNNRGNALDDLGRCGEALQSYERALVLRPDFAEAHYNRGNALHNLNRHGEALASYERALTIRPEYTDAHVNRGNALRYLGWYADALQSYDRALAIEPRSADAWFNRGHALGNLKRYPEALASYARAQELDPDLPYLYGTWLRTRMRICDWDGVDAHFARIIEAIDRGAEVAHPFTVLAIPSSLATQKAAAQTWVRSHYPARGVLPPIPKRAPEARIRLGYFSANFWDHATSRLAAELFERHDRTRFELTGFSFGPDTGDEVRARVAAAFDRFVDVRGRSDVEVALMARKLGIDIAVDLDGFTEDARTGIFALRAAPLQVNYLGYPGTMGADYIDYVIADCTVIVPADEPQYTEKIVYLPNAYQVNDTRRRIADRAFAREELGLPDTEFVFCSFNNNYKLTPETFERWMRLLQRVPGSVLWLLEDNEWSAANLRKEAAARGVSPERLIFARRMPLSDHLARHSAADLFLDSLPYNAHTTASDALWAGLPVLTLAGTTFAGRVAASLLAAVGLPELVTHTATEYMDLAVELATHPVKLSRIRERLAASRLALPLFDIRRFTRDLEAAYATMQARHRQGLAPEPLHVPRDSGFPPSGE